MGNQTKLSKKDLQKLKRLEELDKDKSQKKQNLFKWVIVSISSLVFLGFFIFIIMQSKQNNFNQKIDIPIAKDEWIRGDVNAPNTLVEFSDFECPACKFQEAFIQQALKEYDGKLRVAYKYFLIDPRPNGSSVLSGKAAEAAGLQGKFWEMHDLLFEKQNEWKESTEKIELFKKYAKDLKLNIDQFEKDMNAAETENRIMRNNNEGIELGVNSTPTFFLNNERISGARSYLDFKKTIDEAIKQ